MIHVVACGLSSSAYQVFFSFDQKLQEEEEKKRQEEERWAAIPEWKRPLLKERERKRRELEVTSVSIYFGSVLHLLPTLVL